MPGKVNPTQAEALTMIAVQVMERRRRRLRRCQRHLEMNVYKPLMIHNITHSITIMTDGCTNFRKFLVEGTGRTRRRSRSLSALVNTRYCAGAGDRRQIVQDRALRDGQ
jgi:fumarate hydratase class II